MDNRAPFVSAVWAVNFSGFIDPEILDLPSCSGLGLLSLLRMDSEDRFFKWLCAQMLSMCSDVIHRDPLGVIDCEGCRL